MRFGHAVALDRSRLVHRVASTIVATKTSVVTTKASIVPATIVSTSVTTVAVAKVKASSAASKVVELVESKVGVAASSKVSKEFSLLHGRFVALGLDGFDASLLGVQGILCNQAAAELNEEHAHMCVRWAVKDTCDSNTY